MAKRQSFRAAAPAAQEHKSRLKSRLRHRQILAAATAVCAVACAAFVAFQRHSERVGAVLDRRAQALYGSGDFSGAERTWLQAIQRDPTDPALYAHLGGDYLGSGRLRQAIQTYTAATLLQPQNGLAWLHLAQAELAQGNINQAVTAASQASRLLPRDADADTVLGQAQEQEKDGVAIGAAIVSFRRARAIDPDNRTAALELARAEMTYHQTGKAEQDFLPYLRSHLGDPEACFLLAGYCQQLAPTPQNLQDALQYAQQACAEASNNLNAALETADVELELGRPQEALKKYLIVQQLAAQQKQPQSSRALSGLMHCYLLLHNPQAANAVSVRLVQVEQRNNLIQHEIDALSFNPASPQIADTLAALEEKNGDMHSAEAYYALAVHRSPQNSSARALLAAFYRRMHQPDQAAQALDPKFVP